MTHPRTTHLGLAATLAAAALTFGCGVTPPVLLPVDDAGELPAEDAGTAADAPTTPTVDRPVTPGLDAGTPSVDLGFPSRDVTTPPTDAGVPVRDAGEPAFCPRALCMAGTRCCESLRRCLPGGVLCPDDPPPPVDAGSPRDAGPSRDVGFFDAGPRGCTSARECGAREECVFPVEGCARAGVCSPVIECLRAETFCSCAGETYSGCRPDRATASRGACASADAGPGTCRTNADCGRGSYCAGDGCGTVGTCATLPTACTREYAPVCGCDGSTYGNACTAAAAGVRVASRGECARDAGPPGCASARDCAAGQECVFPAEGCASAGVCMGPIACLRAETFCSCAGETYSGCRPTRPTASRGACASADAGPGGCRTNADCARNAYCAGDGCDTAGTCAARPEACPANYAPVCGCDGRTYSNTCVAASSGVRVRARGTCSGGIDL